MRAILFAPPHSRAQLEGALGGVTGLDLTSVDRVERIAEALGDAEILVMPANAFTPAIEEAVQRGALRWIQLLNAGFDRLPSSLPAGIAVSTAGPGLAPSVADHAVALLLALGRSFPVAMRDQAREHWDPNARERLSTLVGKTVAVVGFGSIGREVARRLHGFGVRVIAVSRGGRPDPLADEVMAADRLDEALERADAVVAVLPLTPGTRRLFDARRFAQCRPGTLFVNVGRGATVDHAALREALAAGILAGAGLDVTDPEPLPAGDPLWSTPNVLITPHCAGGGGYATVAAFIAENVGRFMAGQQPLSLIAERG